MNVEARFNVIQNEIHAEYDRLSNRMNWYVASQSFLLSAFAISGGAQHDYRWFLRSLIPVLGLLISLVLWGAMLAATTALEQLRRERAYLATTAPLAELPFGKRPIWIHILGSLPPLVIPLFFIFAWGGAWYWAIHTG